MFESNTDGTFATKYLGRFGPRGWGLAIADFNEDGLNDFITGNDIGSTTEIKIHTQKKNTKTKNITNEKTQQITQKHKRN